VSSALTAVVISPVLARSEDPLIVRFPAPSTAKSEDTDFTSVAPPTRLRI